MEVEKAGAGKRRHSAMSGASPSLDQALSRLRGGDYFVAGPARGSLEVVVASCAGAGAGVSCGTSGTGDAGGAAVGSVTGIMMSPVTPPLTPSFCFLLVVPRATRVALAFAARAASSFAVNGVRALGGEHV